MERREHRILVVDDDAAIRSLLVTVLRRRGLRADSARDGKEALELLALCRYSVLLLDLMMPTMTGWEVLDILATAAERPEVIVLTAGVEPSSLRSQIVRATIRKPFDLDLIVGAVVGCLETIETPVQPDSCPPAEASQRPIPPESN